MRLMAPAVIDVGVIVTTAIVAKVAWFDHSMKAIAIGALAIGISYAIELITDSAGDDEEEEVG